MESNYQFVFVDGVATADAAFRAFGQDLAELFASCAAALFAAITDLDSIAPSRERRVSLSAADRETLLYDWLSELVYLKDVNRELYSSFSVRIETGAELQLVGVIRGEAIDSGKHETSADVKAVTYHQFRIKESETGLEAFVILDL